MGNLLMHNIKVPEDVMRLECGVWSYRLNDETKNA